MTEPRGNGDADRDASDATDEVLDWLADELTRTRGVRSVSELDDVRLSCLVEHPALGSRIHDVFEETLGVPVGSEAPAPATRSRVITRPSRAMPHVELPHDAPRRLDRYNLVRELGRGGMGIVYLGYDEELQRLVAIKVLPAELARQPELRARFEREVAAVTQLEHPGIVPVYTTGEEEGLRYYVMRFVEGVPLHVYVRKMRRAAPARCGSEQATAGGPAQERVRARPTRPDDSAVTSVPRVRDVGAVLHIVERVARALDHAHQQGVTHRDVKPSNIMVDSDGNPQLLDFGLARFASDATITQEGRLLGTVPYMSPEQVATRRLPLDHRTDVYSLGATLYECLTGRPPFTGDTLEAVMFEILMRDPLPPRKIDPDLGPDIDTVTLRCLEKNPHHRFASCGELAEELARIRAHKQIESEPVGVLGRLRRWASRNRALATLTVAALAAALLLAAVWLHGQWAAHRERDAEALRQAEDARAAVAQLASVTEERAALAERRRELLEAPRSDATVRELSAARRRLRRLDEDERRLRARIVDHFRRSLAARDDASVREDRAEFLLDWHRTARARGDQATLRALAGELAATAFADRLVERGRLSLRTRPDGARVRAQHLVRGADGRLQPDDGGETDLGLTPIESAELAAGSYRLIIEKDGFHPARYPVLIEAGEHWGDAAWHGGLFGDEDWAIRLLDRAHHDGDEWCYVPRGPFRTTFPTGYGGPEPELRWEWVDGFLIARREVTYDDYLDFLEETDLVALAAATPATEGHGFIPSCHVAGARRNRFTPRHGELVLDANQGVDEDEMGRRAVSGVSAAGLRHFIEWLGRTTSADHRLPTAAEWEKAARGVDGRTYPWGDVFDWSFTRGRRSTASPARDAMPAGRPGSFPADESPYGVLDMAGNVREWCQDGPTGTQWLAGGSCYDGSRFAFVARPLYAAPPTFWGDMTGVRPARSLD